MSFSSSLVKKRSSLDSALIRISGMVSSSRPNTTITITVSAAGPGSKISSIEAVGDTVTVRFDGNPAADNWSVAVAKYDQHGKMTGIAMVPCTGWKTELALEGAQDAYELRSFVMDGENRPIWGRFSVSKQEA